MTLIYAKNDALRPALIRIQTDA